MTVIKRNQIIALSVAVMIVAAGYLNYSYKGKNPFSQELTGSMGDKFASQRLGEATLVQDTNDVEIGQASPVSSNSVVSQDKSALEENNKQVSPEDTDKTKVDSTKGKDEQYFDDSRMERERVRDQETGIFERILASNTTTPEAQVKAQNGLTVLSNKWEKEMVVERLIKAKGFKDAIVFINDKSVNVVVLNNGPLVEAQVAQIKDIVVRETSVPIQNIKIVSK